jgi:hypothetical protein
LDQTPDAFGIDFNGMIYGNGTSSLCGGGDGKMAECDMRK